MNPSKKKKGKIKKKKKGGGGNGIRSTAQQHNTVHENETGAC